jgi:hypothetical protein
MRTERQSLPRERHWICARRLRERRIVLGLTQLEVADALRGAGLDLGNRALSAMEHGHALDLGWLPELAAALDCTTTYLLGMTDDPHDWEPAPVLTTLSVAAPSCAAADPGGPAPPRFVEHHGWILGPDVPDRSPASG